MATKREARPLAEFFKFRAIGQVVAGKVDTFGKSGQFDTQYMTLVPAIIRESKDGTPRLFGSIAVGLSADLLAKINPRTDTGVYLAIEFTGREPSKKGSPKKVFDVSELTEAEFTRLETRADRTTSGNAYRSDVHDDIPNDLEGDDDLPF